MLSDVLTRSISAQRAPLSGFYTVVDMETNDRTTWFYPYSDSYFHPSRPGEGSHGGSPAGSFFSTRRQNQTLWVLLLLRPSRLVSRPQFLRRVAIILLPQMFSRFHSACPSVLQSYQLLKRASVLHLRSQPQHLSQSRVASTSVRSCPPGLPYMPGSSKSSGSRSQVSPWWWGDGPTPSYSCHMPFLIAMFLNSS